MVLGVVAGGTMPKGRESTSMRGTVRTSIGRTPARRSGLIACFILTGAAASAGCNWSSAFNPQFVELFDAGDTGQFTTVQNATGHVPLIFVNRLQYSSQLLEYLGKLNDERRLSGLPDGLTSLANLRPRVRMQVLITFENGNTITHEFVAGDGVFETELRPEEDEDLGIPETPVDPQLTEDTLSRLVASCDVASVEIVGDPQVFVPVTVRTIRVEVGDLSQQTRTLVNTDLPRFWEILQDDVDDNFNITLARNYGVREAPAPALNVTCGSMVGIVLSGAVAAPFTAPEDEPEDEFIAEQASVPGFVDTDINAEASIPGRFEFLVTVQ